MQIQARSGSLHWTPLYNQIGQYSLQATASNGSETENIHFDLTVGAGDFDPAGLYVASNGDDSLDGSAEHPFLTIAQAVRSVSPGQTIYVRGGEYHNTEYGTDWGSRTKSSLAQITTAGTASAPITLRPHGNEYVRLVSDVSGLALKAADYWTIQGLELAGSAATLNLATAMNNWWTESGNIISGRGIASNGSDHLTIRDCIIHDFPGTGISFTAAEFVNVQDNIVFNNAWWTTGGVHGISAASLSSSTGNAGQETVFFTGNLVFSNQSLVISHVFSKGSVSLTIDEGNGLHLQDTGSTYQGIARVSDNLMLFNGKAGLGVNTMNGVIAENNAFYQNARVVDTGELAMQSSTFGSILNNLFQPRSSRITLWDNTKAYTHVSANATTGTTSDGASFPQVLRLAEVFNNPGKGDFSAAAGSSSAMGVSAASLSRMNARISEYGITITAPSQTVDEAYLASMKSAIVTSWPASYSSLILVDKATGYSYSYKQRCYYPSEPQASDCP
jgi:hypothetical protein